MKSVTPNTLETLPANGVVPENLSAVVDSEQKAGDKLDWKVKLRNKSAAAGGTADALVISSAQGGTVIASGRSMINMSSNNYLDLANSAAVKAAAADALQRYGFGMASARFLSGTHELHIELERITRDLLQVEDCIAFGSCFDANAGFFEALLDEDDCILSDELNHASIIDGVRLSRTTRMRYKHCDMEDLERQLSAASCKGITLIVTDGVFSMNGSMAPLEDILRLARRYGAYVMVDDCHGIGVIGSTGRGTLEHFNLLGKVDVITGTYGKSLGGAMGGFVAGSSEIIKLLRMRARPYLFSNGIPPHMAAGVMRAILMMQEEPQRLKKLWASTEFLRTRLVQAGLDVLPGTHPITPVMLGNAEVTQDFVAYARGNGILVSGIQYPVVARGKERVRLQVNAGHSEDDLAKVVEVFSACHQERDGKCR